MLINLASVGSCTVLAFSLLVWLWAKKKQQSTKQQNKKRTTDTLSVQEDLNEPLLGQQNEDSPQSGPSTYKCRAMCWRLVMLWLMEVIYQVVQGVRASIVLSSDLDTRAEHWVLAAAGFVTLGTLDLEQNAQRARLSLPVGFVFVLCATLELAQLCIGRHWGLKSVDFWHTVFLVATALLAIFSCSFRVWEFHCHSVPPPEFTSGFFSYITFSWFTPVLKAGSKKQLDFEDLPSLVDQDQSKDVHRRFMCAFQKGPNKKSHSTYEPVMDDPSICEEPRLTERLLATAGWNWYISGFFQLLGALCTYISPVALQQVTNYTANYEEGTSIPPKVIIATAAMFCGPALQALGNAHSYQLGRRVGCQCYGALISSIFQKMSKVDMSSTGYSIGELTNLMAVDAQILRDFISYFHLTWSTLLQLIICIGALFWILGWSAVAGLVFLLLSLPLSKLTTKKIQRYQENVMARKDERMSVMNEVLSGIRVIKLFAWERDFSEKIRKCREKEITQLKYYQYMNAVIGVQWTSTSYIVGLLTFIFHTQVLNKTLTAGAGFASLSLFTQIRFPLLAFPDMINRMVQARVSLRRIGEFLTRKELAPLCESEGVSSTGNADQLPTGTAMIINGTFRWGAQQTTAKPMNGEIPDDSSENKNLLSCNPHLNNINLDIQPGSLVCIYGPTGCGKSSLLLALLGEIQRIEGMVRTQGSIAYVSQKAWIQNATVRENILFGKPLKEINYRGTIAACALRPDLQFLDGGDLTEIGEKGVNLSGGQQQRISLARAVYADADLYLLDDVLSAVDAHVGEHIFSKCIKGILRHKTRLLVTHQVGMTVGDADYIVLMGENGTIIEQGRAEELQNSESLIGKMIRNHGGLKEEEEEYRRSVSRQSSLRTEGTSLIGEEERSYGAPELKTYLAYFKACGGMIGFAIPFILAQVGCQVFEFGQNYSLSLWVDELGEEVKAGAGLWLYIGITGGLIIVLLAKGIIQAIGSLKASRRIHDTMTHTVLRAPCSWYESTPLGRILNRFSSDMLEIDEDLMGVLSVAVECFGSAAAVVFVIGVNIPWLFLPLAIIIILAHRISQLYLQSSRELKRLDSISKSPVYAFFSETINGISTVRALGQISRFYDKICLKVDENIRAHYHTWAANRWLNIRMELLGALVSGISALFVVITAGHVKDTIAGLLLTYSIQITGSLAYMVRYQAQLEMEINAVERTEEYSHLEQEAPAVIKSKQPQSDWPSQGEIWVNNLTLKYPRSIKPALRNLSFHVPPRTRVGIVGRTAAGKSSLTTALLRIVEPQEGSSIVIDGINILEIGLEDLRSKLAIVPQDPVLFRGTIRSNLDPFERYSDSEKWDALSRVKLAASVNEMPQGLDGEISEGGTNFSVGQRQLICMARAILRRAAVLFMDEATANVDPDTDNLIQDTMKNEFTDCTVLCIAHRLNTIIYYDKVMVLEQGSIMEYDAPEVLLQNSSTMFYKLCERSGSLAQLKLSAKNCIEH